MGAQVLQLKRTRELDVIVRKAPGHRDLRDQVGTLFIDTRPDGTPFEVTFEPCYPKLKNVVIEPDVLNETNTQITLVDADDNKLWRFEVYDLDEFEDEGEADDED